MALLDFSQVASPVPLPRERPSPVPLPRPRPAHTPGLDWSAVASPAPEGSITTPSNEGGKSDTLDWSAVASPIEYGSAPVPPVGGGINPMVVRQPAAPAAPLVDRGLPPVPGAGVPQPVASADLNASPMVSHAPQVGAPRPMGPLGQGTGEPGESAVTRVAQAGLEGANANEPIGMAYDGPAEQEMQRAFGYQTPQYFIAEIIARPVAAVGDAVGRLIGAGGAMAGQGIKEVVQAVYDANPALKTGQWLGNPEQARTEVINGINMLLAEAGMKPVGEAAGSARSISPEIQRFLRKAEEIPPPPVPETPTSPIAAWARSYERKALPPPSGVHPAPPSVAVPETPAPPVRSAPVAPPAEAPAQGAPPSPVAGLPPVPAASVRFYHGWKEGGAPDGGSRWVTPNYDYAKNFRSDGKPNNVSYVDIPKKDIPPAGYDEINDFYRHFDAPAEIAKNLRPVAPPVIAVPPRSPEQVTPPSAPETAAPATPTGLVQPAAEAPALGLHRALAGSDRASGIRGMEGERSPDPHAQDIIGKGPAHIRQIEDALSSVGVTQVKPLAGGFEHVVLDAGDKVVRLGQGIRPTPDVPYVLKPISARMVGGTSVEVLPKVDTASITAADLAAMQARLKADGLEWTDAGEDNLGRLPSGEVVIIDGTVKKAVAPEPGSPAAPVKVKTAEEPALQVPEGHIIGEARATRADERRLHDEAKFTAIAKRKAPFSSERGYGNTPIEAQRDALSRIKPIAGKAPEPIPPPQSAVGGTPGGLPEKPSAEPVSIPPTIPPKAAKPKTPQVAQLPGMTPIGAKKWTDLEVNDAGDMVQVDERGIRSIVRSGVRRTEPVILKPGGGIETRADRGEWTLASENPSPPAAKPEAKPAAKPTKAASIPELRTYAESVVGPSVRSVHLIGSQAAAGNGHDIDLLYELPQIDLPADTNDASEAVTSFIEDKTKIDAEGPEGLYNSFFKVGDRYFVLHSGAGTEIVENTKYAKDQAGRPTIELAQAKGAPEAPAAPTPAPKTEAEPPAAEPAAEGAPSVELARRIAADLRTGDAPLTMKALLQSAADVHGGTLAEGKFDRKDVYDAMELAVNIVVRQYPSYRVDNGDWQEANRKLKALLDRLPTQTVRSEEQIRFQQFSTPPNYAAAVAYAAGLRGTDVVMEPSAGTGSILAAAMRPGVTLVANELSPRRVALLKELVGDRGRVFQENAEQIDNILPESVKPTVVVMNSPFSQTAGRMGDKKDLNVGSNHIDQALARLEPGGRLVAIVAGGTKGGPRQGVGMAFDAPRYKPWWDKIRAQYDVKANIPVEGSLYAKYGTSFGTRLLVIDKVPPSGVAPVTTVADTIPALFKALEPIRNGRPAAKPIAAQPDMRRPTAGGEAAVPAAPPVQPATGGLGPAGGRPGGVPAERPPSAGEPSGRPPRVVGGERPGVAPIEPERPVAAGAGEGTRPVAGPSVEPAGGGVAPPRGDLQPPAGGQPGAPAGGERASLETVAPGQQSTGEITDNLYEAYQPQRVRIAGAKPHPGPLVQSAAMSSVDPPVPTYQPHLPKNVIDEGLLSVAQLEPVVYAGQSHERFLPAAEGEKPVRRGFFVGDGTGSGKGRIVAGIVLDNWQQGRTKHVWVSEKKTLLEDARRDWSGLGQNPNHIFDLGKTKAGEPVAAKQGIAFVTYDTLKGGMSDQANLAKGAFIRKQPVTVNGRSGIVQSVTKGKDPQVKVKFDNGDVSMIPAGQVKAVEGAAAVKSRVDQLVDWLGPDFDGVIAFDEAHNMGNAISVKGDRGMQEAAQKALAGIALQQRLPNARVVYVSATGATEVSNLAYADRLGLWGRGTPFADRNKFISDIESGGIAAMELVARDMKQLGLYTARNLSYDGVEYNRLEHTLDPAQREIYDQLAEAWQVVLKNMEAALELTGGNESRAAKNAAKSAFWSSHQRFFNQIITSLQMPSVVKGVERDLAEGRQAVLQLTNTNEASQERAAAKAQSAEEIEDLDITPRDMVIQLVEKSFPTQQYEKYVDDEGNERTRPVTDAEGKPVENREAVRMREALIDKLASIRVPQGPLDMILDHFGIDTVAEVTGRGRRFVMKPDPQTGRIRRVEEPRPASANLGETQAFQSGKKRILVFSEAGGTGRSYHADNTSPSKDARRAHYLVQAGWRADKAVQGFGRTHRTNQASAPIFTLVTTDLQGQKRFISSIARRLSQLGALTKGQRQAGDQGIFSARDNLESTEANVALQQFYTDLLGGRVEGVDIGDFEAQTGLVLRQKDDEGGIVGVKQNLPPITQFLNRLLSMKIDMQNRVFNAFSDRMDRVIDARRQAGLLDLGLETVKADKVTKNSERTVHTDPETGAETDHVKLTLADRFHPRAFQRGDVGWVQAPKGKVYAVENGPTHTDARTGELTDQYRLRSPVAAARTVPRQSVNEKNGWRRLEESEARALWKDETAKAPEFIERDLHLITGAILPIWDRLKGSTRVVRLQTDAGERFIGRVVPDSQVAATLDALGAKGETQTVTPAKLFDRLMAGGSATLSNGWRLKRSLVAGEDRVELIGPSSFGEGEEVKKDGVFTERIQFKNRYFVPTEETTGPATLERLTKFRPVTASEAGRGETTLGSTAVGEASQRLPDIELKQTVRGYSEHSFDILENGRQIGALKVAPKGTDLRVVWVGTGKTMGTSTPLSLGPGRVRAVLEALQKKFPDAETISGRRVSGARDRAADVRLPLPAPRVKLDPRQVANLEKALTNIVHRVFGKNVDLSFKPIMRTGESDIGPEYRSAMDRFAGAGGKTGSTMGGEITWNSNGEAVIRLATQDPKFAPRDSAYHEAYHGVEGMLMTDAEFAAVTDAKEMAGIRQLAADALGLKPAAAEALPGYEARAIAFAEYAKRRDAGEATGELARDSVLRRFFEKLRHLLATIKRMLANKGFKRFEDIFEDVYRGKMAERPRGYRDLMDMGATAEKDAPKANYQTLLNAAVEGEETPPLTRAQERARRQSEKAFPVQQRMALDKTTRQLAARAEEVAQMADRFVKALRAARLKTDAQKFALHQKITKFQENVGHPANQPSLTPVERKLYDDHYKPLFDLHNEIYHDIMAFKGHMDEDQRASFEEMANPEYVHHVVQGKGSKYDRIASEVGYGPIMGRRRTIGDARRALPISASAIKSSAFYALENDRTGKRIVLSQGDGRATHRWIDGKRTEGPSVKLDIGNGIDAKNGDHWTVQRAKLDEKMQHAPVDYYQNVYATTADSVLALEHARLGLEYFDQLTKTPEWARMATKKFPPPDGWKQIDRAPLQGWYLHPTLYQPLIDFYGGEPILNLSGTWLEGLNRLATASIFISPIPHVWNVAMHAYIERGWDWLSAPAYGRLAVTGAQAMKSVMTRDARYIQMMRDGAPMFYSNSRNNNLIQHIFDRVGAEMETEKPGGFWHQVAKVFDYPSPAALIPWFYKEVNLGMWMMGDMLMAQRILELQWKSGLRSALSQEGAIKRARQHIPDYVVPPKVAGSRILSRVLQDMMLTMFGRYRYSQYKTFFHDASQTIGLKKSAAERGSAIGRLLMAYVAWTVLYPMLDEYLQKILGIKDAQVVRGGPFHIIENAERLHEEGARGLPRFLFTTFIPSPVTTIAIQALSNHELWKSAFGYYAPPIIQPKDTLAKAALHEGAAVAGALGIGSSVRQIMTGGPGRVIGQNLGVKIPYHKPVR